MTKSQIKFVVDSYAKYFGRAADADTIEYYGLKENGKAEKASEVLKNIITDADVEKKGLGLSNEDFVNNAFQNLFSRNATLKEINKYTKVLEKGKNLPINSIVKSAAKADKAVNKNKLEVAAKYAELGVKGDFDLSKISKGNLVDLKTVVTLTDLTKAIEALADNSGVPSSFDGKAFVLTTGVDNIAGTAKNDLVEGATILDATNAVSTTSTFTVVDKIALGAGTKDTFNLSVSGGTVAGSTVQAADITGLEVLNVRNVSAGTVTLNASTISGLTEVVSDKSTSILTVTDLAKDAAAGVKGNGTVINGASNFGYVAEATDAVLNISNGVKAGLITMSGTGVKTQTVNSTGAANTINGLALAATTETLIIDAKTNLTTTVAISQTTADKVSTLNIKGDGKVDLDAGAIVSTVTTVDASANKGGIELLMNTKVDLKVTGSTGNDKITTGAVLTTGSVDAGAGTDTLVLGNVNYANTAALAAKYTNFETLSLNGTLDVSLIAGITAIELSGASNISKLSATQAANVTATADIVNTTIALADSNGTADVLSLTMGDGKGNAFDAGALTINGFETLNVKANGISTGTIVNKTTTIASFVADKLEKINLAGTAVEITNAATTKAVTIDASALTGNGAAATATQGLTIAGGLKAGSTVIGSSVNDEVTLAAVAAVGSTFNLGAGDDKINSIVANLRTAAVYNTIDGGAGKDTLAINNGLNTAVTLIDDDFKGITNVEAITIATSGTADQIITTGGWYNANFKAAGSEITTVATTGDITFAGGTFEGNQTITATTVGALVGDGAISITTGSGNDKVTVSAAAAGDDGVINTGAGNDTIELVGTEAFTITGGAGNDTIKLNANNLADTIVFGSTAALNGVDAITGFKFGNNATTDDVLKVSDFTGAKSFLAPAAISSGIDMVAGGAKNVTALTDIQDLTSANFGAVASNTVIKTAADSKYFIIADKAGDADTIQNMYYVETNASNVATVTLVGTINEGTLDTGNIA